MFRVVAFLAVVFASVNAVAFTDLSCTNMDATNTKFAANATNCDNKFSAVACATLFGVAVVEFGAVDRDTKCNKDAAAFNPEIKQLAISTCPKHCGYCCETPEHKCENKLIPRVKCETVTPAQCIDPIWRPILVEDCPKTCGLCHSGGCVDKAPSCANDPSICRQIDMQVFVKENCQRTCGFCTGAQGNGTNCVDSTTVPCATWATNGFCTNNYYTVAQRRQYCPRTCNLC